MRKDSLISPVTELKQRGWPNVHKVHPGLQELYHARGNLSVVDDVMIRVVHNITDIQGKE